MTLPYDVCRCAGHLCPERETCLRYTCPPPEDGRDVPQMLTMRKPGKKCESRIGVKK